MEKELDEKKEFLQMLLHFNECMRWKKKSLKQISKYVDIPEEKIEAILQLCKDENGKSIASEMTEKDISDEDISEHGANLEKLDQFIQKYFYNEIETTFLQPWFMTDQEFQHLYDILYSEFKSILTRGKLSSVLRQKLTYRHENASAYYPLFFFQDFCVCRNGWDEEQRRSSIMESKYRQDEIEDEIYHIDSELTLYNDAMTKGLEEIIGFDEEEGDYIYKYTQLTKEEFDSFQNECDKLTQRREELEQELEKECSIATSQEIQAVIAANAKDKADFLERDYFAFYDMDKHEKNNLRNIDSHSLANSSNLTAVQKRSILEIFLDHCMDARGYLIPEHFGSGIGLLAKDIQYIQVCFHFKRKPSLDRWCTEEMRAKFPCGSSLPIQNGDIFDYLRGHMAVFYQETQIKDLEEAYQMICDAPDDLQKKVRATLQIRYLGMTPHITNSFYYRMRSEYFDILSQRDANVQYKKYTKKRDYEIYRIVYEYCAEPNSQCFFSHELLDTIIRSFQRDEKSWILHMCLVNYYLQRRSFDRLLEYIEEKSVQRDERERE